MITEDYCSPEVSKLLREKGLDKEHFHHYVPVQNGDGTIEAVSVCTHQMAMKWLRNVHNLCISPYAAAYRYGFTIDKCDTGSNICNDDVINEELTNYEEAVEAALKYCLTYLI